jgi:hypothetical protein
LEDHVHISEDLMLKQDVDKRVKSLTKLTKDHAVTDLTASFFDSTHPLPEVCIFLVYLLSNVIDVDLCLFPALDTFLTYSFFPIRIINSSSHSLIFPRKGLSRLIWPPLHLKPPRLKKTRIEMKPKNLKMTLAQ